jgi:hypothetical protein
LITDIRDNTELALDFSLGTKILEMLTDTISERRTKTRHATSVGGFLGSSRGARRSVEIIELSGDGSCAAVARHSFALGGGFGVRPGALETPGAESRWPNDVSARSRLDRPIRLAVRDHGACAYPPEDPET